jgi:hypothetical protein
MIYLGKVVLIQGNKLFVTINDLGGSKNQFGPLPYVANGIEIGPLTTEVADSHTHTIDQFDIAADYFQKGDRVVVAQIGSVKDELVVLGKLA